MPTSKPQKKTVAPNTGRPASRNGRAAVFICALAALLGAGSLTAYAWIQLHFQTAAPVSPAELSLARTAYFNSDVGNSLSSSGTPDLSPFQWPAPATTPSPETLSAEVNAHSAIVVNASTGEILFEKNADTRIPPASMTKLVAMYTAFHAAENGEISFDDIVDLPPGTWAVNIPDGSSLMFLGEGQRVTVRELLLGMAVASGNDAAMALAIHVSGSVEAFVERMNNEMKRLGLEHTRFVEPSGLSERNMTTAREFADFALVYIREYPEALRAFHSRTTLEYPLPDNLPPGSAEQPVIQHATNKLLGVLEGCDGLKTGFINESGYNLSLTAERRGDRYISVTMGGGGHGSAEGSRLRSQDGTALMEWAFGNFRTIRPEPIKPLALPVFGGAQNCLEAIPTATAAFSAPMNGSDSDLSRLTTKIQLPAWKMAPIPAGEVVGTIEYSIDGVVVHSVPLIADRGVGRSSMPKRILDRAAVLIAPLLD